MIIHTQKDQYSVYIKGGILMTDQELLLAISDIMDKKIKSELQPVRDELKMMNDNIQQRINTLEQRLDARILLIYVLTHLKYVLIPSSFTWKMSRTGTFSY